MRCEFASDNTSGICPEVWQALEEANEGYVSAYGEDEITARAASLFREVFETDCDVYFVFNGTAANSLALASLCQSYHSVICHERGHIETDECGGPEFFSNGTKILLVSGENGKAELHEIEHTITKRSDIHYPRPKAISITEPTELGTVYGVDEVQAIASLARRYSLKLHMDGARLGNAIASLNVSPKEVTWKAGVDVLSLGGTKGGSFGEAVVFFNRELSTEFAYRCKQAGQLASKMRFLAAPWIPLLGDGLWLKYSAHANTMAKRIAASLSGLPSVKIIYPVQANSVFVKLPEDAHSRLSRSWRYYRFIGGGARFMCSWKTTEAEVEALTADIKESVG